MSVPFILWLVWKCVYRITENSSARQIKALCKRLSLCSPKNKSKIRKLCGRSLINSAAVYSPRIHPIVYLMVSPSLCTYWCVILVCIFLSLFPGDLSVCVVPLDFPVCTQRSFNWIFAHSSVMQLGKREAGAREGEGGARGRRRGEIKREWGREKKWR